MGEYAIRKSDNKSIKVGTCKHMMYCRYDQINEIEYEYMQNNLLWRIPSPHEDHIQVGEFEPSLLIDGKYIPSDLVIDTVAFDEESKTVLRESAGITQVRVEALGLLCNIKCYHGLMLPKGNDSCRFFWNGYRDPLYMSFLKNTEKELLIGIECHACREKFSISFDEIEKVILSTRMKLRLLRMCTDYWYEHNDEPCYYHARKELDNGNIIEISSSSKNNWYVKKDGECIESGDWNKCEECFTFHVGSWGK